MNLDGSTPIVAVRHRVCGTTFTPPEFVLGYLNAGLWKGGLDCWRCTVYRPLFDFDLLGQGWDAGQEDLPVSEGNDSHETPLTRVSDVPPSTRAQRPATTTPTVESDSAG